MWKNRYVMMVLIIFLTIVAIFISQLLGGQNVEMTTIAVLGVIITIFQWFIPIGPGRYGSREDDSQQDDNASSRGFRGDRFIKH